MIQPLIEFKNKILTTGRHFKLVKDIFAGISICSKPMRTK